MRTLIKRVLIGIVFLFMSLIALAACFGSSGPSTESGSVPVKAPESAPVTVSTPFGQSWETDGLQLTVGRTEATQTLGMKGFCAPVTYVNGSDEAKQFNMFDWKMGNSDGVVLSPTFIGGDPNKSLGSGDLNPGGKRSGTVCFEDKGKATPTTVTYDRFIGPSHDWS